MKNPVEVQPPGCDRFFIVLGAITSRDRIPFSPLDDVPLDLFHSPDWEFDGKIARRVRIAGSTHRVNFSIAPRTG